MAGVSDLKYQWTTSTTAPAASTFTTTYMLKKSNGTGDYYLWILAKDKLGNQTITKSNVFKLDNTIPSTCTITGLPTDWTTSATLTVSGTDNESGVSGYSWDGTNYSTTKTKLITANGTYTAYVKDKAGNIKKCNATITKIDALAPTAPVITGGTGQWQSYNQVVWNTTDSTAASGIKKYQYCINSSNTTTGCSWSDLYNNMDKNPNDTAIDGMDVAFYHQIKVDLINAYKGNVHSLYSHYLSNGKAEGRSISCTGSCSWIRNAQNISKNGESYVFFRAISNSGLTSSASNSVHLKIDTVTPTISIPSQTAYITSPSLVYTSSFGISGGTVSCINTSNNNAAVTTFNSIGILGQSTITCTAISGAGTKVSSTGNIIINGEYWYGYGLYGTNGAYQSGTSVIIPTNGIQYGPYTSINPGCYQVWYDGNNLNVGSQIFDAMTNNVAFYQIKNLNFISANANYYLNFTSQANYVETRIINSTSSTITVNKIYIWYKGSSC